MPWTRAACGRVTWRRCWGLGRWDCARCRPRERPARRTCSRSTRCPSAWLWPSPSVPRRCTWASRTCVRPERAEVHMGLLWLKSLTLRGGQANVIGHVDRVLAMLSAGVLDPTALVTRHMKLEEAPEAYAVYDRREALKIVLTP